MKEKNVNFEEKAFGDYIFYNLVGYISDIYVNHCNPFSIMISFNVEQKDEPSRRVVFYDNIDFEFKRVFHDGSPEDKLMKALDIKESSEIMNCIERYVEIGMLYVATNAGFDYGAEFEDIIIDFRKVEEQ